MSLLYQVLGQLALLGEVGHWRMVGVLQRTSEILEQETIWIFCLKRVFLKKYLTHFTALGSLIQSNDK